MMLMKAISVKFTIVLYQTKKDFMEIDKLNLKDKQSSKGKQMAKATFLKNIKRDFFALVDIRY